MTLETIKITSGPDLASANITVGGQELKSVSRAVLTLEPKNAVPVLEVDIYLGSPEILIEAGLVLAKPIGLDTMTERALLRYLKQKYES